jgi:hypothetical protein
VFRPSNYGVAGFTIVGLKGDQRIGRFHGRKGTGRRVVIIIGDLFVWNWDLGCRLLRLSRWIMRDEALLT